MLEPERFKYREELTCDECGVHIGWVYAFDLNGSHFWCDACTKKLAENTHQPQAPLCAYVCKECREINLLRVDEDANTRACDDCAQKGSLMTFEDFNKEMGARDE